MNTDRRVRLWRLVVEHARGDPVTVEDVCAGMLSETGLDGCAVTVTLSVGPRETLYASNRLASELAELALTLGEGPSLDASTGGPVLIADLAATHWLTRWPAFSPAAAAIGVRAIFALPLQVGGIRLGVIDLHRGLPGPLSQEPMDTALMLADTACALLIDSAQAAYPSPDGDGP
jgi:GAF domain-containing protein